MGGVQGRGCCRGGGGRGGGSRYGWRHGHVRRWRRLLNSKLMLRQERLKKEEEGGRRGQGRPFLPPSQKPFSPFSGFIPTLHPSPGHRKGKKKASAFFSLF